MGVFNPGTVSPGITIKGLKEVSDVLKRMDKKAAVRLIRKAFRRALIPVRDRTRELAPERSGELVGALKIMAGRTTRGRIRQRVVIGKKPDGKKAFYGGFQELGWLQGSRKLGPKRTKIKPDHIHFMHRAYEQEGGHAADKAEEYIWAEIIKVFGAKTVMGD